jgi:hypothetical protein
MAPVDDKSFEEWQKLKALTDDVGIAMMITEKRLLLLEAGNRVRVLSTRTPSGWWQARVMEGEHFGKVALLQRKVLQPAAEAKGA